MSPKNMQRTYIIYVMLALHYDHYTVNLSVHLININQYRHISLALPNDKVPTQLIINRIPQIKCKS